MATTKLRLVLHSYPDGRTVFVLSLPHILLSPLLPLSLHPSLSPPFLLLLIPGLLFVSQFPCVFVPNLLSSSLLLSRSAVCSLVSPFLPHRPPLLPGFSSTCCFLSPSQYLIPHSFPAELLRSLALSGCPQYSDTGGQTDRMWGQMRRGSEGAWAAHKQNREAVRDC